MVRNKVHIDVEIWCVGVEMWRCVEWPHEGRARGALLVAQKQKAIYDPRKEKDPNTRDPIAMLFKQLVSRGNT